MNHRMHIGPHFIDEDMHRHFAGLLPLTPDLPAICVDYNQIVCLHETFVRYGWSTKNVAVRQARAQIPVGGCQQAFLVGEVAKADNFLAKFLFRHNTAFYNNLLFRNPYEKYTIIPKTNHAAKRNHVIDGSPRIR